MTYRTSTRGGAALAAMLLTSGIGGCLSKDPESEEVPVACPTSCETITAPGQNVVYQTSAEQLIDLVQGTWEGSTCEDTYYPSFDVKVVVSRKQDAPSEPKQTYHEINFLDSTCSEASKRKAIADDRECASFSVIDAVDFEISIAENSTKRGSRIELFGTHLLAGAATGDGVEGLVRLNPDEPMFLAPKRASVQAVEVFLDANSKSIWLAFQYEYSPLHLVATVHTR